MTLIEVHESPLWEAFMLRQRRAQFLQSWAWGEFRRSRGFEVRRFALVDETGQWNVAVQMEFRPKYSVSGYWLAPRGPIFSSQLDADGIRQSFRMLIECLLKAKLKRSLFWRMEPCVELGHPEGVIPMRFRRYDSLNPSSTIMLDLAPSADELLSAMHQKTRYNIRVAQKHGVTTRIGSTQNDVEIFLDLMEITATRDEFIQHNREYLRATVDALSSEGMARIRLAQQGGKVLAANLEILYGDTVTYLYGTSSTELRNIKGPYAIQWDAITQAKRDGFALYDFWGANPLSRAAFSYKESWEGITRFKRGWGGQQVDFYGTWDLPFIVPLYHLAFPKHFLRG